MAASHVYASSVNLRFSTVSVRCQSCGLDYLVRNSVVHLILQIISLNSRRFPVYVRRKFDSLSAVFRSRDPLLTVCDDLAGK